MPHRYFTAEVGNGRAALNGTDAHHLADVMRAKIGENVILCDAHAVGVCGHHYLHPARPGGVYRDRGLPQRRRAQC